MTKTAELDWKPFNEVHSIEAASASVNFLEPLTEVAWKKVVREAEAVCKAAGLAEKQVVNTVQFTVGPSQLPETPAGSPAVEAMVFLRTTAVALPGAGIQRRALESFQVGRFGLVYLTATYSRWDAFSERLGLLVKPSLRSALYSVGVANLRLEYKDNFRFTGVDKPIARSLLNPKSTLIVPHAFDNDRLWHSHTGFFEAAAGRKDRLVQVNIDANSMQPVNQPDQQVRVVSISTAVQDTLVETSSEALENEGEVAISQLSLFESMHDRCIELFKEIVSADIAVSVGLEP